MTTVKEIVPGAWQGIWRGQHSRAMFNSRGAALAWIGICNARNEFYV